MLYLQLVQIFHKLIIIKKQTNNIPTILAILPAEIESAPNPGPTDLPL